MSLISALCCHSQVQYTRGYTEYSAWCIKSADISYFYTNKTSFLSCICRPVGSRSQDERGTGSAKQTVNTVEDSRQPGNLVHTDLRWFNSSPAAVSALVTGETKHNKTQWKINDLIVYGDLKRFLFVLFIFICSCCLFHCSFVLMTFSNLHFLSSCLFTNTDLDLLQLCHLPDCLILTPSVKTLCSTYF